jgi:hypothetical protein
LKPFFDHKIHYKFPGDPNVTKVKKTEVAVEKSRDLSVK